MDIFFSYKTKRVFGLNLYYTSSTSTHWRYWPIQLGSFVLPKKGKSSRRQKLDDLLQILFPCHLHQKPPPHPNRKFWYKLFSQCMDTILLTLTMLVMGNLWRPHQTSLASFRFARHQEMGCRYRGGGWAKQQTFIRPSVLIYCWGTVTLVYHESMVVQKYAGSLTFWPPVWRRRPTLSCNFNTYIIRYHCECHITGYMNATASYMNHTEHAI